VSYALRGLQVSAETSRVREAAEARLRGRSDRRALAGGSTAVVGCSSAAWPTSEPGAVRAVQRELYEAARSTLWPTPT